MTSTIHRRRGGLSPAILVLFSAAASCEDPATGTCTTTDDCAQGTVCSDGSCVLPCRDPSDCQSPAGCRDGICQPCTADVQCGKRFVCSVANGACGASCGTDSQCQVEAYCTRDATCDPSLPDLQGGCDRDAMCLSLNCVAGRCCPSDCAACNSLVCLPACGNSSVDGGEQCDEGSANGAECWPPAGGSCQYCDLNCQWVEKAYVPICVEGEVTTECLCGGAIVSAGFCCNGEPSPTDCVLTTLRLDGGLASGTSSYGGKLFVPLLPFVTPVDAAFDSVLDIPSTPIANTRFDGLYWDETWVNAASATITIPVKNGTYSVHLHFVDWDANPTQAAGDRQFHVDIQGVRRLTSFDIIDEAGGTNTALVKSFNGIRVTNGALTVTIINDRFYAEIAALEVVPNGEPALLTTSAAVCGDASDGECPEACTHAQDENCPEGCACDRNDHCEGGCGCDPDCAACPCDTSPVCESGCACDPDCQADLPADYYISADGDDDNSGTTRDSPWQTIGKFNEESAAGTFTPGQRIAFRRGDVFVGTIRVSSSGTSGSPVTLTAYDSGPAPIIEGFATVTGWSLHSPGIYRAPVSVASTPNMLTIGGVNTPLGRYPDAGSADAGWKKTATWGSYPWTTLTDPTLASGPNFEGGEIVGRTAEWIISRGTISDHSGASLTFSALAGYDFMPMDYGTGYFIQNHVGCLTKVNEWAYSGGYLYVYFGAGGPSASEVRVAALNELLTISGQEYVTIENLHFEGANRYGLLITNSDNVVVRGNIISFSGIRGIFYGDANSSDNLIEYNTITHSNDGGIYAGDAPSLTIQFNDIRFAGALQGMGASGDNGYNGITAEGDNTLITANTIMHTGYDGIRFGGDGSEVSYNFIDTHCIWKDDGGGIYSFREPTAHRLIDHNIILNGVGEPLARDDWDPKMAHGIYTDGCDNVDVTNNIVYNNYGNGLNINVNRTSTITGNTGFANHSGQIGITSYVPELASGLVIENNVFLAKHNRIDWLPYSNLAWFISVEGDNSTVDDFGISDHNYFGRPINNDDYVFVNLHRGGWAPGDQEFYDLAEWQANFGQDPGSHECVATVSTVDDLHFIYNRTFVDKSFTLSAPMVDAANATYSGTIVLAPFTAKILIGAGTVTE